MLKRVALLLGSVGLAGCLTSNVLVTVRPDGSGTIEHTATLRPAAMGELEKLLPPELTGNPSPPGATGARPLSQTLTSPGDGRHATALESDPERPEDRDRPCARRCQAGRVPRMDR